MNSQPRSVPQRPTAYGELWMVTSPRFTAAFEVDGGGLVVRAAPILRRRGQTLNDQAHSLREGEDLVRVTKWGVERSDD